MATTFKTAALAFAAMAGLGVAAPVVAYYANNQHEGPATFVHPDKAPTPETLLRAATTIDPVIPDKPVVVQKRALRTPVAPPPVATTTPEPPRCYWHMNEALATGRVWVCDVGRTSNERPQGTFKIDKKIERLAPRDAPSPTGFTK
jgi:hypothetical protein